MEKMELAAASRRLAHALIWPLVRIWTLSALYLTGRYRHVRDDDAFLILGGNTPREIAGAALLRGTQPRGEIVLSSGGATAEELVSASLRIDLRGDTRREFIHVQILAPGGRVRVADKPRPTRSACCLYCDELLDSRKRVRAEWNSAGRSEHEPLAYAKSRPCRPTCFCQLWH